MITPYKVVWLTQSSIDFDLWAELAFDAEQGPTSSFLNKEAVMTEHYNGTYRRIHSYKYNEVAIPRITFVKNDYSEFSQEESRKILAWITAKDTADWLDVYHDDSNVVSYRLYGNFITANPYKISNGRVIGYECEFESSSPYAWSQKYEITKQVLGHDNFNVTCNSDEYNKLLYPKVIMKPNGENIYIQVDKKPEPKADMISNAIYTYIEDDKEKYYVSIATDNIKIRTEVLIVDVDSQLDVLYVEYPSGYFCVKDGRSYTIRQIVVNQNNNYEWKIIAKTGAVLKINTSYTFNGYPTETEVIVKGMALDEEITLDGTNRVISVVRYDEHGNKVNDGVRIMGDDFNWEWLPLACGKNNITITGNCDVQIQWIEPRKIGNL